MSGVSGLLFIHVRKAARWGENDFTKCVCVRIYVKEIVLQTHAGSLLLTFQKVCTRFKEKSWEPSDAKMRLRDRKDTDQPEKPQSQIDFCNSLYSIVNSECVIGLRRLWLACADAQAIQGLCSPHLFQVHFFPWRCSCLLHLFHHKIALNVSHHKMMRYDLLSNVFCQDEGLLQFPRFSFLRNNRYLGLTYPKT